MQNYYSRIAPSLLTIIEFFLLAAAGLLILFFSVFPSGRKHPAAFRRIEIGFERLARRQTLAVLLVGLSVIATRLTLIPILGVPRPGIHDEFSYLLAADTFAHGRLTNPTHPMWVHFESFHVIQKPTYMSIYPPAQGLVLAAGQLMGGPWIGQVVITALMCAALCWMLQGWLPPPWAFFGAMMAVLRLGILSYWMNGYWAASIVALGGALVLGAWPRLRKQLRVRDALLMSLGLAILAASRPYEGLVFSIPVAFAMAFWLLGRNRPAFSRSLPDVVLPILLSLLVAATALSYYHYRVTGNPFRMAYQVNAETYAAAPLFIWQTPRPEVAYRHEAIRDFYSWEMTEFEKNRTFPGFLRRSLEKFISSWQFYVGPLLTLPLLVILPVARRHKMVLALLICCSLAGGLALETWSLPHYFAPATGALYLLMVGGVRQLWHWAPRQRPVGRALVRAIPLLACAMIILRLTAAAAHVQIEPVWPRGNLQRAAIMRQLQQLPGQHLVIVSYGPTHNRDREWVYNSADIDGAKTVWARDMGTAENQELFRYFKSRSVWRVNGDDSSPWPRPYEAPH